MPNFRPRRTRDDVVVVTRRKAKPKSTPVGRGKTKKSIPKKARYSKPKKNIRVKVKSPTLSDQEKPVKQRQSTQDKRKKHKLIDPEIFSAITSKIDALLPEPPFMIGINKEIFKRLVDSYDVSRRQLRRAVNGYLRHITSKESYLKTAMRASHRHGLDGGKTIMTEAHRKDAAIRLKRTRVKQSKSY